MKQLSLIIMSVVLTSFLCFNAKAAVTHNILLSDTSNISGYDSHEPTYDEPEQEVWWYFIRVRLDSKKKEMEIIGTGSKLTMGTLKAFSKAVWWGIAHRQVAIGPFYSEEEANNSKIYYRKSKDKGFGIPSVEAPGTMYWFQISFRELKRMGTYEYTRSPAAVNSGSATQFSDALFEGMSFQSLSVGPFWDYTRAEEAKSIYRENE